MKFFERDFRNYIWAILCVRYRLNIQKGMSSWQLNICLRPKMILLITASIFALLFSFCFWLYWVLTVVWGPSLVVAPRASLQLQRSSSVVVTCRLSCPMACGILAAWPGIRSTSSTLKGGFLTTEEEEPPRQFPGPQLSTSKIVWN